MEPSATVLLAGRYRIGDPLGSGGMATVYEALDERLGRTVAVKVLRPDMAARPDVRARFEAEARSAASLTHPNVVAVFDTGEDDGVPFLVMEKLPGETLADRIAQGPADVDWVLRVAGDVLGALGAAHAAGIVHRDVKPGNILLAVDGCAKVADFGIAKSLEVAAAADLTSTNQLVGTPAYVAPERISGHAASPQSDLYAVAVVLYEALGGRKPFDGPTPVATAYAVQHETPAPLATLRPDLPPAVLAAVERAMQREPSARFPSAADMATALGVGVAGVPPTAAAAADDPTVLAVGVGATQVLPAAETAAAVPAAAPVPVAVSPPLLEDRRRLFLVAAASLVVALILFALAASAGDDDGADGSRPAGTDPAPTTAAPATTAPPTTTTTAPPAPVAQQRDGDDKKEEDKDDEKEGEGKGKGDD